MPQDSPATVAGTDAGQDADTPDTWAPVNRRTVRDDVDRFRNERMQMPTCLVDALQLAGLALEYYEHAQEVYTRTGSAYQAHEIELDNVREKWIRVLMGEAVGFFTFEEREAGAGGRAVTSRTAAEKIVDTIPGMEPHLNYRWHVMKKKAEAEKELGVARRRHATALTFAHAFMFEPHLSRDLADILAEHSIAQPDVSAGDTDRGTLSEVQ